MVPTTASLTHSSRRHTNKALEVGEDTPAWEGSFCVSAFVLLLQKSEQKALSCPCLGKMCFFLPFSPFGLSKKAVRVSLVIILSFAGGRPGASPRRPSHSRPALFIVLAPAERACDSSCVQAQAGRGPWLSSSAREPRSETWLGPKAKPAPAKSALGAWRGGGKAFQNQDTEDRKN